MSTTIKLERTDWKSYFDTVARELAGKQVEIEIASLDIGSQVAARWLPALGVTYDEKNDLLAVIAEGLDHMISHPREVFVESEGGELRSINAIDAEGASQIIRFRDPPAPPAA
ncbi:hypothetical protein GJV26_02925 [Massilia dura]|uniref:Uncharacterized protein n=1 Tax=Pseudoduganella dura TaxID=321982 RepID=A0A6I3X6Q2_9BURK|nr:DUF5335 domain-containing protein [Pseudoduganella dura]MUI11446.1 hypothetical protein [Pseudoduganella dura]GGX97678.1 hypothetical protein GCM10007386_30840 [Pseudoduganella dura]